MCVYVYIYIYIYFFFFGLIEKAEIEPGMCTHHKAGDSIRPKDIRNDYEWIYHYTSSTNDKLVVALKLDISINYR